MINQLKLPSYYTDNVTIIDAYPGPGVWSAALHNTIKPKQYIAMEPNPTYRRFLDTLQQPSFQVVASDPFRWRSFTDLVSENIYSPIKHARSRGIHPNLLVTANLSMRQGEQLCTQYINCITNQSWLESYGRVRLLLWVRSSTAIKLLLGVGHKNRSRISVQTESACKAKLIIGDKHQGTGNGLKDPSIKCSPVLVDRADFYPTGSDPPVLLQLDPLEHQPDNLDSFEYVLRMLFILRSKPVQDAISTLGAGALQDIGPKIGDDILKLCPRDLTLNQLKVIVDAFDKWPFKPDLLHDFFEEDANITKML